MVLLNVVGAVVMGGFARTTADYISMMWRAGPIAMGVASGLYFMLFHWSAGLGRKNLPLYARKPMASRRV